MSRSFRSIEPFFFFPVVVALLFVILWLVNVSAEVFHYEL